MIRYRLLCDEGHDFDAWFRNSDDFEQQKTHMLISCPLCSSTAIDRGLMAPAIAKAKYHEEEKVATSTDISTNAQASPKNKEDANIPAALPNLQMEHIISLMRDFKKTVIENAVDVGEKFAEEARKIHYGDTDPYGIYGKATTQEVMELAEDGIDILPLPILPEERN